MSPQAYLFDMDHTLINNDCDVSWKEFLLKKGIAQDNAMEMADFFFEQYKQNSLDINSFLNFQLAEFADRTEEEMADLSQEHFETMVKDKIYSAGRKRVADALNTGAPVALLTATNKTLAKPLADELGIPEILACEVKIKDGKFLPELGTLYSHGKGKIVYAEEFLARFNLTLEECAYFGDSTSDIPVLEKAGFPYVVNPSLSLRNKAVEKGWNILCFN